VLVRTSIPQGRGSRDWVHCATLDVASSVIIHEVDFSARLHVDGPRESGGESSSTRHEVKRSVRERERDFVVGNGCNSARLSGGKPGYGTRKGGSNRVGRVRVREDNDGSAGREVGVGTGVKRRRERRICDGGGGGGRCGGRRCRSMRIKWILTAAVCDVQ
jgi:hypothetical protein